MLMGEWFKKGILSVLYDLILIYILLLMTLGFFYQGISRLFLLGAALVVLLVFLRHSNKIIKVNIVAISIIIFLFIYGIEFYFTYYSNENAKFADWVRKGFDTRTEIKVYDDLWQEKMLPVFNITPNILLNEGNVPEIEREGIFPLAGISQRLTILCNETGKWAIYKSDEHGFNNPLGQYKEGIDLLLIGDSFSQGYCVEQNETIAANLRNKFPSTISLGAGGNGEISRLASLIEYGPTLKPKIVLWIYTENTLGRLWGELSNPILNKYYKIEGFNQLLFKKQTIIDRTLEKFSSRKVESYPRETFIHGFEVLNFLKFVNLRINLSRVRKDFNESETNHKKNRNSDDEIEIAQKILKKAKKTTESWGGKFYFVYLDTQYTTQGLESDHEKLIKLAKNLQLNTIDTFTAIEKVDALEIHSYKSGGHFNANGYRLVSRIIVDALSGQQKIINGSD